MEFFMNPEITIGIKLLEVLYIVIGLISMNTGIINLRDKKNPAKIGTAIFWCSLGIIFIFGRWLPPMVSGFLVILMAAPAIIKRVKPGISNIPTAEETKAKAEKIGLKIFIPALCIGCFALGFALFTKLSALLGVGLGVIVAAIILRIYSSENKPNVFLNDSRRLLDMVGPLSMLPMLLASLGAIFTSAGVGDVIAQIVGKVIPAGNVNIGIIVFAIGMAIFTMIMGNAFAAITVMTVGIGAPFALQYGVNPVIIGSLALTCGYCGTLMTPMAANFNIVPVAILEMKDNYGVIKKQIFVGVFMLAFQICYMMLFK
ncbi:MAG: DUF979 domain-containing protein [Clostridium sp.]|uniref:DUF979 domain-containing protein n=1 Tax=Clostridium sp. TaxID=1506 RepID=UPI00304BC75B